MKGKALGIALLDNYDSFTFNIVELLRKCGVQDIRLMKNDAPDHEVIATSDGLILSPGPGIPEEAGELLSIIDRYAGRIPILGICLGHQAIGLHYGAHLIQKPYPAHGLKIPVQIRTGGSRFFPPEMETTEVGLYHSWLLSSEEFPQELEITAWDEEGRVMGLHTSRICN